MSNVNGNPQAASSGRPEDSDLGADARPQVGACADLPHNSSRRHIEDVHSQALLVGEHEGAGVHYPNSSCYRLVVTQLLIPDRIRVHVRVTVVYTVNAPFGY